MQGYRLYWCNPIKRRLPKYIVSCSDRICQEQYGVESKRKRLYPKSLQSVEVPGQAPWPEEYGGSIPVKDNSPCSQLYQPLGRIFLHNRLSCQPLWRMSFSPLHNRFCSQCHRLFDLSNIKSVFVIFISSSSEIQWIIWQDVMPLPELLHILWYQLPLPIVFSHYTLTLLSTASPSASHVIPLLLMSLMVYNFPKK